MAGFNLQEIIIRIPVILYAITIHEFSHALSAYYCGDPTAKNAGRISMNPKVHLDFVGTILLFVGFFGWGKPVPVNPNNFSNKRWGDVIVASSGPISNLISAFLFGLLFKLIYNFHSAIPEGFETPVFKLIILSVQVNLGLAFFNLIPIFPLDGSHILKGFLPRYYASKMDEYTNIMPMILFGLLIFDSVGNLGIISAVLLPPVLFFFKLFTGLA